MHTTSLSIKKCTKSEKRNHVSLNMVSCIKEKQARFARFGAEVGNRTAMNTLCCSKPCGNSERKMDRNIPKNDCGRSVRLFTGFQGFLGEDVDPTYRTVTIVTGLQDLSINYSPFQDEEWLIVRI
ncbi:hypothetical protein NXS19_011942 [Fusarium pseudograminearum]|nr:hypothetical protein NXS19_011942 [Fusarium pseudograminearum]